MKPKLKYFDCKVLYVSDLVDSKIIIIFRFLSIVFKNCTTKTLMELLESTSIQISLYNVYEAASLYF